jgi:transposase
VAWALRRTTVRNTDMLADKCSAPKSPQQIRGLNQNHNHEMKEIFKSTATRASCGAGPFHDFYAALLAKGMKPEMARLTLARKIAAITLTVWKKEERFDAEQLKTQAA